MKDERKQCKKHHESTIGKIIYGFLLFLPLFAIGSACLISTFNMASKEESEIHYKYETNEVNSNNDLIIGNVYRLNVNYNSITDLLDEDEYIFVQLLSDLPVIQTYLTTDDFTNDFRFFAKNTFINIIYASDLYINTYYSESQFNNADYTVSFIYNGTFDTEYINIRLIDTNSLSIYQYLSISEYNEIDFVETHNVSAQDVFYESVDKVQNSPLFNWTTNTGIYTVLNNTCNSLGITTTFVPSLLAYWLIISVMYFLYDIVLIILNILHRKIHELQESI